MRVRKCLHSLQQEGTTEPALGSSLGFISFVTYSLSFLLSKDLTKKGEAKLQNHSCLGSTRHCSVKGGPVAHLPIQRERWGCWGGD